MIKKFNILVFFILLFSNAQSQSFEKDIEVFKKQDSIAPPPTNAILFIGSSSFTKWEDVQDYFPSYTIINRGFGGSRLTDIMLYKDDIIFPYKPKQIVIYCGENDIASSDTITSRIVFKRFKDLFNSIRKNDPDVSVIYISMKPSISRWHMKDRMKKGNKLIKKYLSKKKKAKFISVWEAMLDENGKPDEQIFLEDKLHMNAKGYAIWQKLIEPYLIK